MRVRRIAGYGRRHVDDLPPNDPDMPGPLKLSPLDARHRALGATMGAFGGWDMPISYAGAGVVAEHTAVRTAVGIFDVSHLGKATVTGPGAAAFVNDCLTADLAGSRPGQAQYTMCCNDNGGVIDDLIAYLVSADEVFLIPNAANTAAVVAGACRGRSGGHRGRSTGTPTSACWRCRARRRRRC